MDYGHEHLRRSCCALSDLAGKKAFVGRVTNSSSGVVSLRETGEEEGELTFGVWGYRGVPAPRGPTFCCHKSGKFQIQVLSACAL